MNFFAKLESILSSTQQGSSCVIIGDINIPVNNAAAPNTIEYIDLLKSYNFSVTNTYITRPISSNILDHVLCSEAVQSRIINKTLFTDISDHCCIITSINLRRSVCVRELEKKVVNNTLLNEKFESYAMNMNPCPAHERLNKIIAKYKSLKKECTTTYKIQAKVKGFCPWITLDIWKWMKIKDKILGKFKRNPNSVYLSDLLKHISKNLQNLKETTKKEYYKNLFRNANPKNMWKCLKDLTGDSKDENKEIKLNVEGNLIDHQQLVAQQFNDFFSNIGPKLAATITSLGNVNRFETLASQPNSIFLRPASSQEVVLEIKDLDTNKIVGDDEISAQFIKRHFNFFSGLISDVFNESISNGRFPDCLKIARVVPVHKQGTKTDPNNYRPISVLPILSKLLEKMLVSRITTFFHQNNLLYEHQYGFRLGSSTTTATSDLFAEIYRAIEDKKHTGLLFLDLKKAFDTIDHTILLKKLDFYGIRGQANDLIKSFLSNRNQYVMLNSFQSNLRPLKVGVPQGSNLGPLLFLIYVNDLPNLKLHGKPRLFADDTCLLYTEENPVTIIQHMAEDMELLQQYFSENKLSLNLSKTKHMILNPLRTPDIGLHELLVDSVKIERVSKFTYLGLTIDSALNWTHHIQSLKSEVTSACGLFWKIKSFVPSKQLCVMYHAFVQSKLQYLVFIWGAATKTRLKPLQVAQNRCLKVVYKRPRLYPTKNLYLEADKSTLPINALRELQAVSIIHNHLHNPIAHHNQTYDRPDHRYSLRHQSSLYVRQPTSEFAKKAFTYHGKICYNRLPENIRSERNIAKFKHLIKRFTRANIETYIQ